MLNSDDVVRDRAALIAAGAVGLGEVADGSLGEVGSAVITNGDPDTGIVDVPGANMTVVRLANGNLVGLRQSVATGW